MKYLTRINKTKLFDALFIVLILASFAIKMASFDYPLLAHSGESSRDYLVANHIVTYGEFPLTGPGGKLPTSPAYYYLLSSFLMISNDIMSLEMASTILWLLIILSIYLLGRFAFGPPQGLIAASLFSLTSLSGGRTDLWHGSYIWATFMMQPFAHLSYLLLFLSYIKKNYPLLIISLFLIIFAGALYNSALGVLPVFMVLAFLVLKVMKKNALHYGGALLAIMGSFLLFYLPVFVHLMKNGQMGSFSSRFTGVDNRLSYNIGDFSLVEGLFDSMLKQSGELMRNISHLVSAENIFHVNNALLVTALLFLGAGLYFFVFKKERRKKIYLIVIALTLVHQVILVYIIGDSQTRYFLPVTGLLFIGVAEIMYSMFSKNTFFRLGGVFLFFLFVLGFTNSPALYSIKHNQAMRLHNLAVINSASDAVINEILSIQQREGFTDLNFFQIADQSHPSIFWVPLEKKLNKKFTKFSLGREPDIETINNDNYIFLACYEHTDPEQEREKCVEQFLKSKSGYYTIERKIYSRDYLSIYTAKR